MSGSTSVPLSVLAATAVAAVSITAFCTYYATISMRQRSQSSTAKRRHPSPNNSPVKVCTGVNHDKRRPATPEYKRPDPFDPSPRQGYLCWDDYFMALAFLSAQRSKDPSKQVGACIVNDHNIILGIGYNGFPRGCSDSELPWAKRSRDENALETKYPYVVHAEANALLNKNAASTSGARIYVTMFPCNECAKLLIQAGINEVVFHENKVAQDRTLDMPTPGGGAVVAVPVDHCYIASKRLLALAGVKLRQHKLQRVITIL